MRHFSAGAYLADLYADEVEILGQVFVGPTHPQALRRYRFALTEEKRDGGRTLYTIAAAPRSSDQAGFGGYLVIEDSSFAVVEAALLLAAVRRTFRPEGAAVLSPIRGLHYFLPVIDELLAQPPVPGYVEYLVGKLRPLAEVREEGRRGSC